MLGTIRPENGVPADPLAPGPLDRTRPRVLIAIAVAVASNLGSIGATRGQPWATEPGLAGLLLLLVAPAALVFLLPRGPALATALSVAATLAFLLLGSPWGPVFLGPVAVLTGVMLSGDVRRARLIAWSGAALLVGGAGAVATLLAPRIQRRLADRPLTPHEGWGRGPGSYGPGWGGGDPSWVVSPGSLIASAAWLTVVLLVASAGRDRIARRVAARAAARETAAERERTAVASERLRIARELHDVLAHSLSAINIQAGVGLHLLDRDPGQARDALSTIRDTSKDALTEVRTVLGIVRDGAAPAGQDAPRDDAVPLTPTWDVTALHRLADQARSAGLDVTVELGPGVADLPDHVTGVVHRVVQESLTNVRRHASAAHRVTLRVTTGDRVEVVVADDGASHRPVGSAPTGTAGPVEPGYGLLGMRERVEGAGGTLVAGPRPDGAGWSVRAVLPAPTGPAGRPPAGATRQETPETGEPA